MTSGSLLVQYDPKPIPCRFSAPPSTTTSSDTPSQPELIFTHGAGGTLTSPAIANFSTGFSYQLPILCFQGNSNLASRTKMFSAVISDQEAPTSLGGRSMGARAAVIAATKETKNLILVSYPLHTGSQVRDEILMDINPSVKVIFVSGDRDSMCDLARLDEVRSTMKCRTWRVVVQGADHGMDVKPKKLTEAVGVKTGEVVAEWIESNEDSRREGRIYCDEDGEVEWTGWEGVDGGVADSSNAKSNTAASQNKSSDLAMTPKKKRYVQDSTKARSSSKKRKLTGQNKEDPDVNGTNRTAHGAPKANANQENVSGRTRAAKMVRKA
ncbi:MAG: hypothetical protein Q9169_007049 [Polycauliona sp. 2 TL-2023]